MTMVRRGGGIFGEKLSMFFDDLDSCEDIDDVIDTSFGVFGLGGCAGVDETVEKVGIGCLLY
jgi:hypothetical protein